MQLSDLIKKLKSYEKRPNISLVKKAYSFAEKAHQGQTRATGEAYIEHPLNVACILADLQMDDTTIAAALLHDVVEDTSYTLKDITNEFGKEIAALVEGMTKIKTLKNLSKEDYHAETIRKVILASVKDIRVIIIKLADRLHNMRTIGAFREEKRKRIAKDALEVYAPIAHKLGIASIKWQLEDLSFEQIEPEIYKELQEKINQTQRGREKEIEKIKKTLTEELKTTKIPIDISGRPKHIYSIWKKMQKKQKSFEEIYDLAALRVITDNIRHCYEILGIIHNLWTPIPKEFDDYIATPKSNMYQSLHTVVIGPAKKPVEVQIRTQEMHDIAEQGIAAHWKYKGIHGEEEFDQKLKWMMELNELQKDSEDAKEFLKMLHIDFFEDEIFAFTPKGKVIELPKGAVVLDFAYAVHSDLGDKCIAAKINGLFVPLRAIVNNGDRVEIITAKTQHPSRDWLKIVKTSKAAAKIKQYVRGAQQLPVKRFKREEEERKELEEWIIEADTMSKPKILLSKCCKPLPGEKIMGYGKTIGKVTVHKSNCPALKKNIVKENKRINVHWIDNIGRIVNLKVEALNRTGLFAEILNTLIAINTTMKSAHAKPLGSNIVECSFGIETSGLAHLQDVIKRVKKIQGVRNVFIGNVSLK
ncbi:bifunctional (p)ppGpp synthetase/guanosine-3',5'-bis(diphosphate) 3'-pyrophosphohydrolase [Candidatus Woesearchaeota archaeon]|nr:bifunctional (p)ppGpp synthetase/guanosine-3',5'-bis(diphosphate) 3'-pyrophosphohydrolase [Candidatus Woesearchaeota archaeon]